MKHIHPRRTAALFLATATVGTLVASPASASATTATTGTTPAAAVTQGAPKPHPLAQITFIKDRVGGEQTRTPKVFQLKLGRTNTYLAGLTWSTWGPKLAQGRGTYTVETSKAGRTRIASYPVNVTASRLARREATQIYTRLTIRFTAKAAPGTPKLTWYQLPR